MSVLFITKPNLCNSIREKNMEIFSTLSRLNIHFTPNTKNGILGFRSVQFDVFDLMKF